MDISPTQTIEQAMVNIQYLPIEKRQSIFNYIDFLLLEYKMGNEKTVADIIAEYPTPTSFKIDDVAEMQRQWRDEWE